MFMKTICMRTLDGADDPAGAIAAAARQALRELPGLEGAQVKRVVRQIPTDYITNNLPYNGVTAEADQVNAILDLHFTNSATAQAATGHGAWGTLMGAVRKVAQPLFTLDTEPNVVIAPRGSAVQAGVRRWLLLTRKAPTIEAFRHGWFVRHAELVCRLPLLEGYVQNMVVERRDAHGQPVARERMPIDGIAELCYASEADMEASYSSEERAPLRDDGAELNARVSTILVEAQTIR